MRLQYGGGLGPSGFADYRREAGSDPGAELGVAYVPGRCKYVDKVSAMSLHQSVSDVPDRTCRRRSAGTELRLTWLCSVSLPPVAPGWGRPRSRPDAGRHRYLLIDTGSLSRVVLTYRGSRPEVPTARFPTVCASLVSRKSGCRNFTPPTISFGNRHT